MNDRLKRAGGFTLVEMPFDRLRAGPFDRLGAESRREGKAFTLIEMLVVIFVIAILVAVVVGVSGYVVREAGRRQTHTNMDVILQAVEAYHDAMGAYPAETPTGAPPNRTDAERLSSAQGLYAQLITVVKAQERVGTLRRDAITTAGVPGQPVFADGFGWYLDYRQAGGRGGRPLLESPGPDGFFDRLTDNIYSDRR